MSNPRPELKEKPDLTDLECATEEYMNALESGEVYDCNRSAEDNCMEEEEWEALKNDPKKRCIVLFPIN